MKKLRIQVAREYDTNCSILLTNVAADAGKGRRGRRADLTKTINSSRYSEPHTTFTTIKPMRASEVTNMLATLDDSSMEMDTTTKSPHRKSTKRVVIPSKRNVAAKKLLRRSMYHKASLNIKSESGVDSFDTDIDVESVSSVNQQMAAEAASTQEPLEVDESERARRESEMLIIEWFQQSQPYHDHGYTSIFGQYRGAVQEVDDAPEDEVMSARTSALKYSKQRFV